MSPWLIVLAVIAFFALCAFIARQKQGEVAAHE